MAKHSSTKKHKVAIKKSSATQDLKDDKDTKRKMTEHEQSEERDGAAEVKRRKPAKKDSSDVIGNITQSKSSEVENLSPEERRVVERKLKKIRRKEEKKQQREQGMNKAEQSKTSSAQTQALEYLTCWSEKRDDWKFQKTRQVWLLQHMYDSEKVSDAHFKLLLSYLEGLCGVARDTTVLKAEALVRWGEGQEEAEGGATDSQKKAHRAREVVQILS